MEFAITETAESTFQTLSLIVSCPSCQHEFEVGDLIAEQFAAKADAELKRRRAEQDKEINEERIQLQRREQLLKTREAEHEKTLSEQVEAAVSARLGTELPALVQKARTQAQQESAQQKAILEAELEENRKALTAAQVQQALLAKEKRELEAEKSRFELEKEKAIQAAIDQQMSAVREAVTLEFEEKDNLKELQLARLKKQVEDLNHRLKTNSSQELQGEACELGLEARLREGFPYDEITPVPKGQRGADIIQHVRTDTGQIAGSIIWESKRTGSWSNEWIPKLKENQREDRATVAILVSDVTPPGIDVFGEVNGVWVVKHQFAVVLTAAIRQGIIQAARARAAADGQETKAELVYQYLTGEHFKARMFAIVETFQGMQQGLAKEKNAARRAFTQREKQHEKVLNACFGVIGDLQGIAGQDLKSLEEIEMRALPAFEAEEEE